MQISLHEWRDRFGCHELTMVCSLFPRHLNGLGRNTGHLGNQRQRNFLCFLNTNPFTQLGHDEGSPTGYWLDTRDFCQTIAVADTVPKCLLALIGCGGDTEVHNTQWINGRTATVKAAADRGTRPDKIGIKLFLENQPTLIFRREKQQLSLLEERNGQRATSKAGLTLLYSERGTGSRWHG